MNNLRPFAFILLFISAGCGGADVTALAPHFTLTTPSGETRTLDDQKGKVVLLNFWATWCESCQDELPVLQELHNNNAPQSFQLLAVSIDNDPAAVVPRYAQEHRITYPLLYSDRKVIDAYAVHMLPTSFLISPTGVIARRYVGPLDAQAVQNDILSLLKRRPS